MNLIQSDISISNVLTFEYALKNDSILLSEHKALSDIIKDAEEYSIISFFKRDCDYKIPHYFFKSKDSVKTISLPVYSNECQFDTFKIVKLGEKLFYIIEENNLFFNKEIIEFVIYNETMEYVYIENGEEVFGEINLSDYGQKFNLPLFFDVFKIRQHKKNISFKSGGGKYAKK